MIPPSPPGQGFMIHHTDEPDDLARFERVARASCYLTLATADEQGAPWATPVWFASADLVDFLWVSSLQTRHSRNLAGRPEVALSIFDSHQVPGTGRGVYVRASAGRVPDADLAAALVAYSAESLRQGMGEWAWDRVTGSAKHRMYRATALERFVLDSRVERLRI